MLQNALPYSRSAVAIADPPQPRQRKSRCHVNVMAGGTGGGTATAVETAGGTSKRNERQSTIIRQQEYQQQVKQHEQKQEVPQVGLNYQSIHHPPTHPLSSPSPVVRFSNSCDWRSTVVRAGSSPPRCADNYSMQ